LGIDLWSEDYKGYINEREPETWNFVIFGPDVTKTALVNTNIEVLVSRNILLLVSGNIKYKGVRANWPHARKLSRLLNEKSRAEEVQHSWCRKYEKKGLVNQNGECHRNFDTD